MSVIATICARGGSLGVPQKNIKPLLGKPLIAYTIEHALECSFIDKVYVSTDCDHIASVAKQYGAIVPFKRPEHLAKHDAPKVPVIEHLVCFLEEKGQQISTVIDLQPTSPLRDIKDIENCSNMLDDETDLVITGYESKKNPYFNMVRKNKLGFPELLIKNHQDQIFCRQNAPAIYTMNGSIYVWKRASIPYGLWNCRSKIYIMPQKRSVDIDTLLDFKFAEFLMQETNKEEQGGKS